MICCSCGKEIDINYGREYWNGIYCKKCADEMLSTPEYIKNYKRIIADLQAENAELRERLSKAVELPCKVGDTIFYVQYFCDYKGCDSTTQQFCCGCKEMIEREKHKEKYVICEKSFVLKDLEKIGKKYFTTREAAEARLAELKGGKQ